MTTYSVWNSGAQRYDYYEAVGTLRDGVFAPNARLSGGTALGLAPDEAARPLPTDAKRVGQGEVAKGMIATRKGLGFAGLDDRTTKAIMLIGAAWLIWKVTR